MSAVPSGPVLDAFLSVVEESFACQLIGFTIATAWVSIMFSSYYGTDYTTPSIYGITVMQTFLYFRRYTADGLALKFFVSLTLPLFASVISHKSRSSFSSKASSSYSLLNPSNHTQYSGYTRNHPRRSLTVYRSRPQLQESLEEHQHYLVCLRVWTVCIECNLTA